MQIVWMLECCSRTSVRQQKRRDHRNRSSIFELLDRPFNSDRKFIVDTVAYGPCRGSRSNGVTWSNFRRLLTSLAAEFRTDNSLSRRHIGAPASRLLQRSTLVLKKQATAVFAASVGSNRIQLLINRSWRKHLLTNRLTCPVICWSASSSMPRSRTVPVGGTRAPQTSSGTALS